MGVQFVLGRSGTGKTRYCIDAICAELKKKETGSLLLLVPEQASFQAERAVLSHPDIAGFDRLSVLSFERLQYQLLGKHATKTRLSALGRQMVVQQILKEHLDRLQVFAASAMSMGFVRQLTETLEELQRAALGPEDIERFLDQTHDLYRDQTQFCKFADIRLIYEAYLSRVEGRFIDPNRQLWEARAAVAESPLVRGARLWVDGFSGFSTAELLLLREMLAVAQETVLALCLDPRGMAFTRAPAAQEPLDLFAPTRATYGELCGILRELKLQPREARVLQSARRFAACPPLAHIERSIFQTDVGRCSAEDRVHCIGAADARAECQFVAGKIRELVQVGGYRYRDIAVIVSDLGRYEPYVYAYFSDHRIPFFIDKQRAMDQHPCAMLIRSALNIVTEGFSTSEVLTYLRTSLADVRRQEIDTLENYCVAFGIGAGDWLAQADWSFAAGDPAGFDEQTLNATRRRICRPLKKLRESLRLDGPSDQMVSAREFVEALFAFLNGLEVSEAIRHLVRQSEAQGDLARADRQHQFYQATMDIVEELLLVFGEQRYPAEFYSSLLLDAFRQMTLAQIPPSMDQVLVGSIERSRHPDVRVVFLVGTTQRQFPAALKGSGVLTDQDRDVAEAGGLILTGGTLHVLRQHRYLAYIAFTRASEQLFVTYPLADEKGNAGVRSQFVDELISLFTDVQETFTEGTPSGSHALHSVQEWAEQLCRRLRDQPAAGTIVDLLSRDERLAEVGEVMGKAATFTHEATLSADVVQRLFGQDLDTSATRLGVYAACPYQYFAKYVLALRPRQTFSLQPVDLGNFYHRVLELWISERIRRQADWEEIDEDALWEEVGAIIERVLQENRYWSDFMGRSQTNAFLVTSAKEVLKAATRDILEMIRAGQFRPIRTEASFGGADSDLGPYEIALSPTRTIRLHGKIDRVDTCTIGGQSTAIVFDYKRKEKAVNWSKLYHGLDLQLVIYLNALAQSGMAGRTAGAFFLPVEASAPVGRLSDMARERDAFGRKARGIFAGDIASHLDAAAQKDSRYYNFYVKADSDPYGSYLQRGVLQPRDFALVREFVDGKIKDLATRLMAGQIDIRPVRHGNETPCSHCDYRTVCRFDWQRHEPIFLSTKTKAEVLETLAGAAGHE